MSPCARCGKEAGHHEFCDTCHDDNLIEDFYETEWDDSDDDEKEYAAPDENWQWCPPEA